VFLKKYPGLLPFLLALLFFLGVNAFFIVSDQKDTLSEVFHNSFERETKIMSRVVRDAVMKHDLPAVEDLLSQWGKANPEVIAIDAVVTSRFI
jgi:hypothetical protein